MVPLRQVSIIRVRFMKVVSPPFLSTFPRCGVPMARPVRLQWEGCWYHITSRGNERQVLFRDAADCTHFLRLLSQMTERFRTRLHVYTLMDNHYHLLLQTLQANLSRAMHWLNSGYSGWFNRRHRRCGHLLQGRYKARRGGSWNLSIGGWS